MITVEAFSRVVSEVYASSVDRANWPRALSDISRVLGGTGSGLVVNDTTGDMQTLALGSTMPAEAVTKYQQYYHSLDFVVDACAKGPPGLIRGGQELFSARTGTEFFNDWQSPFELTDGLFVKLSAGHISAQFAISAPQGREPFDTPERVQFVGALVGHLQQALRTQQHVAGLADAATDIAEALDHIRHGVAVIGATRHIVHLNAAFAEIVDSDDGLAIRSATIEADGRSTNSLLQNAITGALVGRRRGCRSGDSFVCARPSGHQAFVVHVLPLKPPPERPSAWSALVVVVDPERSVEPPKTLIRRVFRLTEAEADVALRIMEGDGLNAVAADLMLSRATVKTHLQHVYEKTGVHRQAELVRLLLALGP